MCYKFGVLAMPLSTVKLRWLVGHKFVEPSGQFYCEFTGQTCCLDNSFLIFWLAINVDSVMIGICTTYSDIIVRKSEPSPCGKLPDGQQCVPPRSAPMEYYPAGQVAAYGGRMAGPPHGQVVHAYTGHGHAGAPPVAHHAVRHANGPTTQNIDDQVISYVTDLQCGDDVGDAARFSTLWNFSVAFFFVCGVGTGNMPFWWFETQLLKV